MPYTIYVPDYDENGRRIIDQRELRIRNEAITPESRQQTHLEMKAQDQAAKAAREKAAEEAKRAEEFRVNAQAAAHYGIPPNELKPASMGIAQMLEAEQAMNAEFEAKKQELSQKYQGPDAGKIARELDELHQKQDAQLAAQFASNPMAEQAIAQRSQEFRAGASSWLQTKIQTRQQQYFDTVDKKCNDALSAQINAMQPEQITSALQTRENEMRALGRSPEQIQAAKQKVLGSYFQNLATTNPSVFLDAMASPGLATKKPLLNRKNGEAGPGTDEGADNSIAASLKNPAGPAGPVNSQNPPNPLAGLAKSLPEEQLGKFSRLAERAKTVLEKKEKLAKLNLQQQKILQRLTGLDPDDQRSEIEKITSGLDDREMAETLKTRLNLQLDYEDRTRAARDWQTGETIINQNLEPLQKIRAIQESDISESAREALIREVMGEAMAETPKNQQSALDALLRISSGAIQQERDLHALFQQQNLTRNQAAFLTEAMSGKGRINGVPVGMAIRALQKHELAQNPGELLNATRRLTRDWPEGTMATYKNMSQQAQEVALSIRPENMDDLLNSDPANPRFEETSGKEKPRDNFALDWEQEQVKIDPNNPEYDKMKDRYGIAQADQPSDAIDKYGYNQLNKDINAEVWRELETKYLEGGNKPVEYWQPAYNRVKTAQAEIKESAEFWGVAPEAVAACMLDEQTAIAKRGFALDQGQDWAANGGFLGIPRAAVNRDIFGKLAYRTPGEMENFLEETKGDNDRYYLVAPSQGTRLWDLGNYNVNLAVGYKCFERYVLNSQEDNPIKQRVMDGLPESASKEDKWKAFISNCLTDQKGESYIVAAVLKDGQKMVADFIEERRKINPEEFPEGCYSPEEFNCLVVDTYKKGFPLMKQQYLERVEKGDISPMKAGPGEGLIFNREMISDVLNKPSMPRKHPRLP